MRLTSKTGHNSATAVAAVLFGALVATAGVSTASAENRVSGVTSSETGSATTLTIQGTVTPTFTVYKLERPSRLVVDVAGARLDQSLVSRSDKKATWNVNTWAVGTVVASGRADRKNKLVRVVVSLARSSSYRVKAVGKTLVVRVTARDPKPAGSISERDLEAVRRAASAKADAQARLATERARQAEARAAQEAQRANSIRASASAERKASQARLAAAKGDINKAQRRAARAEREMVSAKKDALAAKKAANERAARAAREAEMARADARRASRDAAARLAAAEARIKAASSRASRADKLLAAAEAARAEAKQLSASAARRELAAKRALAESEKRRLVAESAKKAAAEYREQADRAKATGSRKAQKLAARATKAAKEAESRRLLAEQAALLAEKRRREAETAERAAVERVQKTTAQVAIAEGRRKSAVSARLAAEAAREHAERENKALISRIDTARNRAREASSQAESFKKAATVARAQAAEARASRLVEQRALADAARARATAEKQRQRAERAAREVGMTLATIKRAEALAVSRRAAAERAASRVRSADAGTRPARQKEANARRRELAIAEKSLAAQRAKLATRKRDAATTGRARAAAARELASIKKAAAAARKARLREEALATRLDDKRRKADEALSAAEKRLADAQRDREQARMANAAASAARAQAEALRENAAAASAAATADRKVAAAARAAADKRLAAAKAGNRSARVRVNKVKFEDKGRSARVVVGLSAPARPKVIKNRGKVAVLEIKGADLAKRLERTLDTSAFGGPIKAISSYRDPKRPDTVRVVVDLFRPARGVLSKVGNTYYWDFPSVKRPRPVARVGSGGNRTTAYPAPSVASSSSGSASTSITQQTVAQLRPGRRRVYRGRRIDLNFKDADIHNLLRILATVGGVNIVVPRTITGAVTVRLKSVPWDQAMEVILSSQGLWYRRSGSLIRVAKRAELEKEDEEAAKRRFAAVRSEAPEPEIFTLNYADARKIKAQLGTLVSPKGTIQIDDRTNALIVNDIASHRRRIIDLARRIDTPTPQIQIEARIVEARTTFVRQFGIQWGGNAAATAQGGNSTGLVFPNSIQGAGAASDGQTPTDGVAAAPTDFAVNLPAAIGTGAGGGIGLSLGSVGGNFNINLRLSALEDSGSARIISQPKITTSNNIAANINSGVSIPISVVSASGTQTQFVPAELSLQVTPKVSQRDCSVSLVISITKNEADFANTGARGDPSILTLTASTTVLVNDGETAVLGGIYTRNTGLNYSKVPFFADIPVLGYLFKNRRENDERAELLMFVTPKITNRASLRCE